MNSLKLLDEELLTKVKGIQIKAKYLVNDVFAGEYLSAFKGRGIEFEEVREYRPGDDIRSIDWNVTARSNKAFVKVFRDERELTVMFMVDVSASSRFGTAKKFKNEVAAEITALLAYTALRNNDKVGLIIFSDHLEHYTPPKKGKTHVWQLIREILSYKSTSKKTDLSIPIDFINKVHKKKSIVFLLSDFQGEGVSRPITVTAKRHDLIAISITDPREVEIPPIGYIELEDVETGESIIVNTSNKNFMDKFSKTSNQKMNDLKKFFRTYNIDFLDVKTDGNYIDTITKFFKERDKR
mgnify:CR=1 FL=1